MSSHRRISTALVTLAAIAGTAGIAIAASDAGSGEEQGQPLTLSGAVEGLTPGAARDLTVTITNPNAKPIVVSSVTTSVTAPAQGCPAGSLAVGDLDAPVTVQPSSAASGRLPVRLSADAPDACQGASFALRFSAVGRGEGTLSVPVTPATPGTTPVTPTTSGAFKTVTVKKRKKVCRTRKVRVRGKLRAKKTCRVVTVKVQVRVPR